MFSNKDYPDIKLFGRLPASAEVKYPQRGYNFARPLP